MRPHKTRKPFTLFKKDTQAGPVWYARFWDETARRYAVTRSTGVYAEGKRQHRYEAEQAARDMLSVIRFMPAAPDKPFVQYVANFWLPDSPYVRECALVKKKPLSVEYVTMNRENVRRHMEPFPGFEGVTLRSLTIGMVRDWMAWTASNGRTGRSINVTLQAMRIAVRYAVIREELPRDPFLHIRKAPEEYREKGILSPAEASRLIQAPVQNPYSRLVVLLGLLCGLRRGEIRGLQWGDIANGLITIRHNYQEHEGLKAPKCGSHRRVPIPKSVQSVIDTIFTVFGNPEPDEYVMAVPAASDKPLSTKYFQRAFINELNAIGISADEQQRRNLTLHALRHSFVTLSRLAGITDFEIQALAGHKGGKMMERYSHAGQVLDFDAAREKLEKAVTEKVVMEKVM